MPESKLPPLWLVMVIASLATVGLVVSVVTGASWVVIGLSVLVILGGGYAAVLIKSADRRRKVPHPW